MCGASCWKSLPADVNPLARRVHQTWGRSVPAADVEAWVEKIVAERDVYKQTAQSKVNEIHVLVLKADEDVYTALKLDDLLERFNDSGVDPAFGRSRRGAEESRRHAPGSSGQIKRSKPLSC